MANTFLTHRQMGEAEAYYKILPNLTLKYSSIDTIFIPTDKKELRSKFLTKLNEGDANYKLGTEVKGGRDGKFLEKPDIIDKYCRREILKKDPELNELTPIQFAKMFDPFQGRKPKDKKDDIESESNADDGKGEEEQENEENVDDSTDPWIDDDERRANFYITTNPDYNYIRLPQFIKLKNPRPGEISLYQKRSFPNKQQGSINNTKKKICINSSYLN